MDSGREPEQALEQIKQMMDRGSRFVSLSGWSGVAAGLCALVAAWIANRKLAQYGDLPDREEERSTLTSEGGLLHLDRELLVLALVTFVGALVLAFFFTYLRSKKTGVPLWGMMARKLVIHLAVPMIVGGLLIWRITDFGLYGFIAPACLLFYGLALINAAKFTLSEVRYLGYLQLLLGVINLWAMNYGLFFWAAGFGVLHILYGIVMWRKYERNEKRIG